MSKGKYENSIGKKYNKLLVLSEIKKGKLLYCRCKCDCGNVKDIQKYSVVHGIVKSCGCLNKEQDSIIGKRYGQLTVIEETNKKSVNNHVLYLCQCSCGNTRLVTKSNLKRYARSCGCLNNSKKYEDIIGQKFGKLTVLEELERTRRGQRKYRCICDCGNENIVIGANLLYGKVISCGCEMKFFEKTKINMIERKQAYPNSKTGIKGVYLDKNGYYVASIRVCGEVKHFYGGKGEKGLAKCIKWREDMVIKYHKPLIDRYREYKKIV